MDRLEGRGRENSCIWNYFHLSYAVAGGYPEMVGVDLSPPTKQINPLRYFRDS
jgi:hypothetical protein